VDIAAIRIVIVSLLGGLLLACDDDGPTGQPGPTPTVVTASGDITARVQEFRQILGGVDNGGDPGEKPSGRRELNWDGVPDELAAPFDLPGNYFNAPTAPRARGAVLSTPGTAVQVSADSDNPSSAGVRFSNINPAYANVFRTFSPERLFSPIGSNIVDLTFFVAGTSTAAVVRGFGAVYTGVDDADTSTFEYFDASGQSLGRFGVPISQDGLSFLGVAFPTPVVGRVRIIYGNVALGPDESGATDAAVMDDFIYGEPHPVP
jgi:hypothetical protein